MRKRRLGWLPGVAALLPFLPATLGAVQQETGALVTDRPDQTESSAIIPPGFVQFEVGWSFSQDGEGGIRVRSHSVPGALARFGLAPRVEGRIGFSGWMRSETRTGGASTSASGFGDIDVGFKYRLAEGSGVKPAVAVIGAVTLPTGEEGFGSERVDPTVRLTFASDLSDRVSVGSNVGSSWTSVSAPGGVDTLVDLLYTLVFGFTLSERFGLFAESFGLLALDDAGDSQHSLDGGFTLLVRENLQFDVSAGVGLNGASDDWFLGAGVAIRLPR